MNNNKNKNNIKKIKYFSFFKENEIFIHSSFHIIETFKLFFFKDLLINKINYRFIKFE